MLIKEYRILLPLTVDEYRIAQLYMIQVTPYNKQIFKFFCNFLLLLYLTIKVNTNK